MSLEMNRVRDRRWVFFNKADLSWQTRNIAHLSKLAQILSDVWFLILNCVLSINRDPLVLATLKSI